MRSPRARTRVHTARACPAPTLPTNFYEMRVRARLSKCNPTRAGSARVLILTVHPVFFVLMSGVYLVGRARRPASRARATAVERAAGAAERAAAVRVADRERARDIVTAAHEGGASIAAARSGVLEAAREASAAAAKPNADAAAQRDAATTVQRGAPRRRLRGRRALRRRERRFAPPPRGRRALRRRGARRREGERGPAAADLALAATAGRGSWRGYRGRFTGFLGIILNIMYR
jgi:hypothetical protein